jgi:NADH dehydrogenase
VRVLVTGAAGFVGRHLVPRLVVAGHMVKALVHSPSPSPALVGANIEVVVGDVTRRRDVDRALEGEEAVVHLAAILREDSQTFEAANVQGPRTLVEACEAGGVGRFIHVSAVGAGPDSPSAFLRSRWRGEEVVRGSPLAWTIVRASLILGRGSGFGRRMQRILRGRGPMPVLGSGRNMVQPVHVEDVAELLAVCLHGGAAVRRVLEVGGPQRINLEELTRAFARAAGRRERVVHIPSALAVPGAGLLGLFSRDPAVTPDEVRFAVEDNIGDNGPLADLGFSPERGLEVQIRDSLEPR